MPSGGAVTNHGIDYARSEINAPHPVVVGVGDVRFTVGLDAGVVEPRPMTGYQQ